MERWPERAIGLVPTMGALHEGHGRLIDQAVRECELTVISIFVNPIQFNQPEDYNSYPQSLNEDLAFCEARGAHVVFAPETAEMYPVPLRSFVDVSHLTDHLCGPFRPGHFRGVATVVMKLFHIVQPHRAYFGEKDAQQLAVIRRMARDLDLPVTVVEVPTVREPDGLALSSRNRHLDSNGRRLAMLLYRALQAADRSVSGGASVSQAIAAGLAVLGEEPGIRVEYLEIVDPDELQPIERITGPVRIAAAVWIGSTRLIDNVLSSRMA